MANLTNRIKLQIVYRLVDQWGTPYYSRERLHQIIRDELGLDDVTWLIQRLSEDIIATKLREGE